MKIERFEDIESWQKAREISILIYAITRSGIFSKDFGLRDQIQRSVVSIMSNIAEGFDSGTNKSFILFLNYAYRSASETQSLLYIALDCNYITNNKFSEIYLMLQETKKLIGGFIKYLKNTNN
jgi:four helix bundle protein